MIEKIKLLLNKIANDKIYYELLVLLVLIIIISSTLIMINYIFVGKGTFVFSTVTLNLGSDKNQTILCSYVFIFNQSNYKNISSNNLKIYKIIKGRYHTFILNNKENTIIYSNVSDVNITSDKIEIPICPFVNQTIAFNLNYIVRLGPIKWTQAYIPIIQDTTIFNELKLIGKDNYNNTLILRIEFKVIPKRLLSLVPVLILFYAFITGYLFYTIINRNNLRDIERKIASIVYDITTVAFVLIIYALVTKDSIIYAVSTVIISLFLVFGIAYILLVMLFKKFMIYTNKNSRILIYIKISFYSLLSIIIILIFLANYFIMISEFFPIIMSLYNLYPLKAISTTLIPIIVIGLNKGISSNKEFSTDLSKLILVIFYILITILNIIPILDPIFLLNTLSVGYNVEILFESLSLILASLFSALVLTDNESIIHSHIALVSIIYIVFLIISHLISYFYNPVGIIIKLFISLAYSYALPLIIYGLISKV